MTHAARSLAWLPWPDCNLPFNAWHREIRVILQEREKSITREGSVTVPNSQRDTGGEKE